MTIRRCCTLQRKNKSNIVATQKIHEEYGGVVLELAREPTKQNIVPDQAIKKQELPKKNFLQSPLHATWFNGFLLVGTSFAKSMAMALIFL